MNETAFEIIKVRIRHKASRNYQGFGGTFASLVDSCVRKRALPGIYQDGLVSGAEVKENTLLVMLSGRRAERAVLDIMDIALRNIGAFPGAEGRADFFVEVK